MRILAINCGSSSIKSALIDGVSGERLLDLRVTGVGAAKARLRVDGVERALPVCREVSGIATPAPSVPVATGEVELVPRASGD